MFVNYTNHHSGNWNKKQLDEAQKYGEIIDMAFPQVNPNCCEKELLSIAQTEAGKIIDLHPDCVLCQGEMTLCFAIVDILLKNGVDVVSACSQRNTVEQKVGDTIKKIVEFDFVRFRKFIS